MSVEANDLQTINKNVNINNAFKAAAEAIGLDMSLLRALCWVESNHNASPPIKLDGSSPSYGICQVKYSAASHMGYKGHELGLTYAPLNIYYAAKFLKSKLDGCNGEWKCAVTAYNRGHYSKKITNPYVMKILFAMREGR